MVSDSAGPSTSGGSDYVTHQGLREHWWRWRRRPRLLSENNGGDSLFEHNQVVAHSDFQDLPDVLEGELDLGHRVWYS